MSPPSAGSISQFHHSINQFHQTPSLSFTISSISLPDPISSDLVLVTHLTHRTLYTNNYYTLMALAKHTSNKYGWTIVGTIIPTDKNSRADHDIPFFKFSNGARNGLQQGWYCEAEIELKTPTGKAYYIKCTT